MTSKATNQRDLTDVIKKQKRDGKKSAGTVRAQASGISGADTAITSGQKTSAGGAGGSPVTQDLQMNTFDIRDVDRLYFSTTAGSADTLTANDTGIESKSSYNGTSYTSYGLTYQVPANNIHTFFIGSTEKINIGTGYITLNDNVTTGGYLDVNSNYIQFDEMTPTSVGTVPADERRLFSDSTNNSELSVKKSDGTVVSLEGAGGWVGTATSDLNMSDYDITTVDRLKFSATGTDNLAATDYGIATDSTDADDLHYNVPSGRSHEFDVAGTQTFHISPTLVTSQVSLWVAGAITATGNVSFRGTVDLGNSSSDVITVTGTPTFATATSFNNDTTLGTYGGGHEVNFNAKLDFRAHTNSTNQPSSDSDGYIDILVGGIAKKLYYY